MGQRVKIPDTAHALDAIRAVFERSNLFAKIADVRVDAAIERRELAAQNIARQFFTIHHLARRAHQGFE